MAVELVSDPPSGSEHLDMDQALCLLKKCRDGAFREDFCGHAYSFYRFYRVLQNDLLKSMALGRHDVKNSGIKP